MAHSVKLQVTGSPAQARPLLEQALQAEGFRFTWTDDVDGFVEKGEGWKAIALGFIAPHYKFRVLLHAQQDGTTIVDLGLGNTGLAHGALGVTRVRRQLAKLGPVLQAAYQSNGSLVATLN